MNPAFDFVWALMGAAFGAGVTYATLRQQISKVRSDVNGIGKKVSAIDSRSERRWKHSVATQIETSSSLEEAKHHARLLREDAWRD